VWREGGHLAFYVAQFARHVTLYRRLLGLKVEHRWPRTAEHTNQSAQRLLAVAEARFDLRRTAPLAQNFRLNGYRAGGHRRNKGRLQAAQWHVRTHQFAHGTQRERGLQPTEGAASLQPVLNQPWPASCRLGG